MIKFIILYLLLNSYSFANCVKGLRSFERNVYPVLRQKCINCHDDGAEAPQHSSSDISKAYRITKTSVDFKNIDDSYFLTMVDLKHWEVDDPSEEGIEFDEAKYMLEMWSRDGEKDCKQNPFSQLTNDVELQKSSLSSFKKIRFDLSNSNESLKKINGVFEIELMKKEGAYIFKNPRLTSPLSASIDGLYIRINNNYNVLSNTFRKLNQRTNSKASFAGDILPGKNLSTRGLVIKDSDSNDNLKLSIGFINLKKSQKVECMNGTRFKAFNKLLSKHCVSCHGDKKTDAAKRMFLDHSNACEQMSERVNLKFKLKSTLLDYAIKGYDQHPILNAKDKNRYLYEFKRWLK